MKEKEKVIVNHWKEVLANYLDPLALIGTLPGLFLYGRPAHQNVFSMYCNHKKHEAVHIAITTIMHSDLTLDNLIDAIKESGDEWLATLVKGNVLDSDVEIEFEKTVELENKREFLTLMAPHIKETIQAVEVGDRLCSQHVISPEEFEQVESMAKTGGNSLAVRGLISHLVRKTTEWLPVFVEILRECNYDATLIRSLEKFSSASSSSVKNEEYTESAIVKEGERPDVKATPPRSGAKNAANFPCTVPQNPLNDNQTPQSYDGKGSLHPLETRGKNVIIFVRKGHADERVAAQVIKDHAKGTLHKVAVIVDQPARLTAMETILKSHVGVSVARVSEINKVSLRKALEGNTVIIMTLQVLESFLTDGSITLYDLTLMIFDNCQLMHNDNYENVLSHIKPKDNHDSLLQLPQIIGILTTANIEYGAKDKVLDVCARMNATGGIISVPDESKGAEHNTMSDPFTMCVCDTINKQMGILARLDLANNRPTVSVSDQVTENLKNKVVLKDVSCWSGDIQACIELLQIFNKALDIHIKKGASDAMNHLRQKRHQNWSLSSTIESKLASTVESELVKLANAACEKLTECVGENWNWTKVLNEIKSTFRKDLNSRIMLIVEKEEHVQKIKHELIKDETLAKMEIFTESLPINVHLTDEKSACELIITKLENGVSKILVCTLEGASCSVLNGIEWNITINYDCTKGMLSKTKIDRQELQKYGSKERYMCGGSSMTLLEEAIEEVQAIFYKRPDDYKNQISVRQNRMLPRKTGSGAGFCVLPPCPDLGLPLSYKVQCSKCKTYLCTGDGIVKLLTNHTFIDITVIDKVERLEFDDGGTETKEGLHCKNCKLKLGIFAKFKHVYLPQLHPAALKFEHIGPHRFNDITAKKWAKVKINFKEVEEALVTEVWSRVWPLGAY